jgi:hypothetical protein
MLFRVRSLDEMEEILAGHLSSSVAGAGRESRAR